MPESAGTLGVVVVEDDTPRPVGGGGGGEGDEGGGSPRPGSALTPAHVAASEPSTAAKGGAIEGSAAPAPAPLPAGIPTKLHPFFSKLGARPAAPAAPGPAAERKKRGRTHKARVLVDSEEEGDEAERAAAAPVRGLDPLPGPAPPPRAPDLGGEGEARGGEEVVEVLDSPGDGAAVPGPGPESTPPLPEEPESGLRRSRRTAAVNARDKIGMMADSLR